MDKKSSSDNTPTEKNSFDTDMKLTLGTTYYENPEYLLKFVHMHRKFVDELIIVDDHSRKYPAKEILEQYENVKLFRVKNNYGFNSHGCRNLIVNKSSNDWILLIDVDREFHNNGEDLNKIYSRKLEKDVLYKFVVHVFNFGNKMHRSVNDFLVHKDLFNSVGGYDEELIGIRTGDRQLFDQMSNFCKIQTFEDVNLMYTRSSTKADKSEYYLPGKLGSLIESRTIKPDPNKKTLTFDWEQIY